MKNEISIEFYVERSISDPEINNISIERIKSRYNNWVNQPDNAMLLSILDVAVFERTVDSIEIETTVYATYVPGEKERWNPMIGEGNPASPPDVSFIRAEMNGKPFDLTDKEEKQAIEELLQKVAEEGDDSFDEFEDDRDDDRYDDRYDDRHDDLGDDECD